MLRQIFLISCLLFLLPLAFGAPPLHGEINVSPTTKITLDLHEEPKKEDYINFSLAGKPLQLEQALGDRFQPFQKNGLSGYFHTANLFGDGQREIFVRSIMVPMGVIRVFRWNEAKKRLDRITFGPKHEDGLPVPLLAPVTLEENGDLTYVVNRKSGHKAKFRLHWNGNDYEIPAKEIP